MLTDANGMNLTEQFIGSWSLISWTARSADGELTHPFGEDAVGRIMYDGSGQMAALLMRRERTAFASDRPQETTLEECEAAFREYFSYYGSFTVQAAAGRVTHHVVASLHPNWVGQDQERDFHFSDKTLTLSFVNTDGIKHELVWEK